MTLRRREFITLVGGAAATVGPGMAWAQQAERVRRIGVLINVAADNQQGQAQFAALQQALQKLGWSDGQNVRIDIRWKENGTDPARIQAAELVALAPDVILASGSPSVAALQQTTRTIPIVFVRVADPVGASFVDSLARPGGNVTGFMLFEYSLGGKWLELLKQIAPGILRAAVMRDLANPAGIPLFAAIQSAAPSLGVEVSPMRVRDGGEIEQAMAAFAHSPNGGLIVTPTTAALGHQDLIIALAARYKLPAIYDDRSNVPIGGLISYGPDRVDQFRNAASYIDRILKGEKPADLPVQAPTKYETALNLKTAKALGLAVPPTLLVAADEVIE